MRLPPLLIRQWLRSNPATGKKSAFHRRRQREYKSLTGPFVAEALPVVVVAVHAQLAADQDAGLPGAVAHETLAAREAEEHDANDLDLDENLHLDVAL